MPTPIALRSSAIALVGFDGDDTLWKSEDYYRDAEAAFEAILGQYLDLRDAGTLQHLLAVERRNLKVFGYGAKGMTLSMIEAAIELTEARIAARDLQRIVEIGRATLQHPVEVIAGVREAVAAIAADPDIDEVILSGGDPLSLATSKLVELTEALADIPHLKRLRIHSRLPVVLPERVDAPLLAWLRALPWPVAFVIHANHANEFDASVDAALAQLRGSGAHLLNQAVLLRGVNDSVAALAALSERSFAAGVLPYYLHQLDRVEGVAHFEVDDATARALHQALAARLSGYLVPNLVREIAGDTGKRAL